MNGLNVDDEQKPLDGDGDDDERSNSRASGSLDFNVDRVHLRVSFRAAVLLIGVGAVACMSWIMRIIHELVDLLSGVPRK